MGLNPGVVHSGPSRLFDGFKSLLSSGDVNRGGHGSAGASPQGVELAAIFRQRRHAGFMPVDAVSSRVSILEGHHERDSPDESGEC